MEHKTVFALGGDASGSLTREQLEQVTDRINRASAPSFVSRATSTEQKLPSMKKSILSDIFSDRAMGIKREL